MFIQHHVNFWCGYYTNSNIDIAHLHYCREGCDFPKHAGHCIFMFCMPTLKEQSIQRRILSQFQSVRLND